MSNKSQIPCEEVRLSIGAENSDAESSLLVQHLDTCAACAEIDAEQRVVWDLLLEGDPGVPAPSADFTERVRAAAREDASRSKAGVGRRGLIIRLVSSAAAAGLLVAVALSLLPDSRGEPEMGSDRMAEAPATGIDVGGDTEDPEWAGGLDELLSELPAEDRLFVALLDVAYAEAESEKTARAESDVVESDWLSEQIESAGEFSETGELSETDELALQLVADLGDF